MLLLIAFAVKGKVTVFFVAQAKVSSRCSKHTAAG